MGGGGARLSDFCLQINQFLKKNCFCSGGGGGGGGGGLGGRGEGEQEGVLGKVNYFYKESKSNIKEKNLGGGGDGWGGE